MVDREWAKPESILDLFLESFRIGERTKHLLRHLVVVALDDQALRYCRRAHPHCYLHRDSIRKSESLKPDGLVTGWSKKSLVKEIIEFARLQHNVHRSQSMAIELPSELVTEILARVPVKDLVRFICVCKRWRLKQELHQITDDLRPKKASCNARQWRFSSS